MEHLWLNQITTPYSRGGQSMATIIEDTARNEQAYDVLREDLEKDRWGKWVIIVDGELAGVHASLDEADKLAESKFPRASPRLVRRVGEELPKEVWKL
jgi:hypothetical protein